MAEETKDKILVIDQDNDEREMLVEATLEPSGYTVQAVSSGGEGLKLIEEEAPDIIILDLHLEGLSGHDVLAAINAQSVDSPVILLADAGAEKEALQAFRLGAKDYIVRPFREAEMIQVVERAMKEVRLRKERTQLITEVQQAADAAKLHLQELKTLMNIGKSITTLRALDEVFQQVIRAAFTLTKAEVAGFFLKDDQSSDLILRAGQNLETELATKMGKPVEDDLAALVMTSRETYIATGEGLSRFKPAQKGAKSVIYAPLIIHESSLGVLWVANENRIFVEYMKDLMTALADYAAIAVVNARLFATMQERNRQFEELAKQLKTGEPVYQGDDPKYRKFLSEMQTPLATVQRNMDMFKSGQMGPLKASHQAAVDVLHRQLTELTNKLNSIIPPDSDTE